MLASWYFAKPFSPTEPLRIPQQSGNGDRKAVPIYDIPRYRIVNHLLTEVPIRASSLRTLGAQGNIFASECFMDELDAAARRDPIAFRLDHLKDPRGRAVIKAAAAAADWQPGRISDGRRGRGFAYTRYKGTPPTSRWWSMSTSIGKPGWCALRNQADGHHANKAQYLRASARIPGLATRTEPMADGPAGLRLNTDGPSGRAPTTPLPQGPRAPANLALRLIGGRPAPNRGPGATGAAAQRRSAKSSTASHRDQPIVHAIGKTYDCILINGGIAMTDLNSLAIFARVVDAKSFSEAARRLRMPISTVSRRIGDLEDQLGVRLLDRSTRNLRLTDVGAEVLQHAIMSAELSDAVDGVVSNKHSSVSGVVRLSAPPSLSDALLSPMIEAFQASYPDVRVQVLVTDLITTQIEEGVDLAFKVGAPRRPSAHSRPLLTYRHQLLAASSYLTANGPPRVPQDLLSHRLLAFSFWTPQRSWTLHAADGAGSETLTFVPFLSMNDYAGLAKALLAGAGIGDLPPVVLPDLVREGRLVEVMPEWLLDTFELSIIHPANRYVPRAVRMFTDFAAEMAPKLFPSLHP